jgi:hypothetical protein
MSQRSGSHFKHRQRLYDEYESVCWLCLRPNASEIDHVIPVSQGGSDEYVNLRLAHKSCNGSRNRRDHPFHTSPQIGEFDFPDRWHHMVLDPNMWRDDFVNKARVTAQKRATQDEFLRQRENDIKNVRFRKLKESLDAIENEIRQIEKELSIVKNEYLLLDSAYSQFADARNWFTRFYKNPILIIALLTIASANAVLQLYSAYADSESAVKTGEWISVILTAPLLFFGLWFVSIACLLGAEFIWFTFGPSSSKLRRLKSSRGIKREQVQTLTNELDHLIRQRNRFETDLRKW